MPLGALFAIGRFLESFPPRIMIATGVDIGQYAHLISANTHILYRPVRTSYPHCPHLSHIFISPPFFPSMNILPIGGSPLSRIALIARTPLRPVEATPAQEEGGDEVGERAANAARQLTNPRRTHSIAQRTLLGIAGRTHYAATTVEALTPAMHSDLDRSTGDVGGTRFISSGAFMRPAEWREGGRGAGEVGGGRGEHRLGSVQEAVEVVTEFALADDVEVESFHCPGVNVCL